MYIYDTPTRLKRTYYKGLFAGICLMLSLFLIALGLCGFKLISVIEYQKEQKTLTEQIGSLM